MSFPKYADYTESQLEYIGPLPSNWDLVPFFSKFIERKESNKGMKNDNLLSLSYGRIIPKDINTLDGLLPASYETYQVVHPGDLVFRLTDLQNDKRSLRSAIVTEEGIITSAYLAVRPKAMNPDFANHLFRCYDQLKVFYSMGGGLRQSMKYDDMKWLPVVSPSLSEQTQIARFLDHETAKIDALIAEQKRLINLLQEKRQAVISHAVTKGLDPNVPMKDSGVEWLGEVPAHWKQSKLKHFSTINGRIGFRGYTTHDLVDEGDGAITLSPSNMVQGRMDYTKTTYISWDKYYESPEIQLQEGDIVLVKTGSTYGRVALVDRLIEKTTINPQLAILRPKNVEAKYFLLFLNSEYFKAITRNSNTGGTMPTMTQESVMNIIATLPSLQEQKEIVSAVGELLQDSEVLESEALKGIDLLKERRAALISAAVTGKIDVRDWQPPADESAFDEDVRKAGLEASA